MDVGTTAMWSAGRRKVGLNSEYSISQWEL